MMPSQETFWERFRQLPVVGILRGFTAPITQNIVHHAKDAGLTNVEVTFNSPGALEQISMLVEHFGNELNIGAGTVTSVDQGEEAVAAGASFLVSPIVDDELILYCVRAGIPIFPGALTPTEIFRAWSLGAPVVKLFPAGPMGISYMKSILAPLDKVRLLPTGGISAENAADFMRAGAYGLGVGSPLFREDRMAAEDWDWLATQVKRFAAACRED